MYFPKLPFIALFLYLSYVKSDDNDTSTESHRKERVSGRIVKLYSGSKPDPIICQTEGFQADPNDCSIFYRCQKAKNEKYTVFKFQCAPGTIYDDEKEICNYPHSARRSGCKDSRQHTDVQQLNEIENIEQELPQPIKTTSPPEKYVSAYEPVPLGHYNEVSEHLYPELYKPFVHKQDNSTTSFPITMTQTIVALPSNFQEQKSQDGDICVADGFMGDSNNCKKFYRCVNNQRGGFIRYEFLCNDGTIWDDSVQGCNHVWLARNTRCGRDNKYSQNAVGTFGNKDTKEEQNKPININITPLNNDNSVDNGIYSHGEVTLQVHNQYQSNAPLTVTEAKPTYVTSQSVTENVPVQIQYGDKIQQHVHESPSQSSALYIENQLLRNQSEVIDDKDNLLKYSDICYKNGFFGFKDDCSKFYRCVENTRGAFTRYEFSCSEGTVWDDNLKACNFAWAVKKCGGQKFEKETLPTELPTEFVNHHTSAIPPSLDHKDEDSGYGSHNMQSEIPLIDKISPSTSTESTTLYNNLNEIGYGYKENHYNNGISITENDSNVNLPSNTKSNKCTKSGFMGDSTDCSKFYRCVDTGRGTFIQYEFSCGEGTVWDASIESCNHAWAVKRCGQKAENNNYVHETTRLPLKPTSNNYNSDNYEEFNSVTKTTAFEVLPNKVTSLDSSTEQSYVNYVSTSTTNSYTVQSSNVDKTSSSQDNNCESEGFFPFSDDCRKFYRCANNGRGGYDKFDFTCGEGTAWDTTVNSCNHIENVKNCNGNHGNEINESEGSNLPSGSDQDYGSTSTTMSTASLKPIQTQPAQSQPAQAQPTPATTSSKPINSDNNCYKEGYFGDNGDCKKFFRCVDDGKSGLIKYEYFCGEGTIWDQDITSCNHPQDVKRPSCLTENQVSTTSSAQVSTSTTSNVQNPVTENSSSSTKEEDKEVTSEPITLTTTTSSTNTQDNQSCNKEGFYGDTNDCKNFYRCVDDGKGGFTKYDFNCGEGTIWDQDILACNHPKDVQRPTCISDSIDMSSSTLTPTATTAVSSTMSTTQKASSTTFKSTPSTTIQSTTDYIQSTTNTVTQTSTTSENTKETTTPTSTTSSSTSTTTEYIKPDNQECSDEGYFGNKEDCKKFHRCVYNGKDGYTRYDFTCGEGTVWDQGITACNHPRDVENLSCSVGNTDTAVSENKEPSTTDSTTASSSTSSSSSSSSSETTDNSGSTSSTESNVEENKPDQQDKGNFTCTKAGFYPNPNDCKKFYRCVDWNNDGSSFSIFHFECGEGTIWDPSLDTCNYEDSVYPPRNCNGTESQTQSSSTENTTTKSTQSMEQTKTTTEPSTSSKQPMTQETTSTESVTPQQTEGTTSTKQESSSTEASSTESSTTTTEQSSSSTSTTSQETTTTTTTERSTTTTDQSTQTDKVTEESTSQGTTQSSTTEQQSTSTTEQSTSTTEQSTSTTEQSTSTTEQSTSTTEQSTSTTEQSTSTTEQSTSTTEASIDTTANDKPTTESSQQTTESSTSSNSKCPEMNENQNVYVCPTSFRRHPKYCDLFYQCTEDDNTHDLKIAIFHCPNNTIYDEKKTQCVNESQSEMKCDGKKAQTHRIKRLTGDYVEPAMAGRSSYACPGTGYFPFEANQECSQAFLKCQRSQREKFTGYVYKCPNGYSFWTVSKRCERMSRIKDCKRTSYPWDKRYDIPTEIRNVAP